MSAAPFRLRRFCSRNARSNASSWYRSFHLCTHLPDVSSVRDREDLFVAELRRLHSSAHRIAQSEDSSRRIQLSIRCGSMCGRATGRVDSAVLDGRPSSPSMAACPMPGFARRSVSIAPRSFRAALCRECSQRQGPRNVPDDARHLPDSVPSEWWSQGVVAPVVVDQPTHVVLRKQRRAALTL